MSQRTIRFFSAADVRKALPMAETGDLIIPLEQGLCSEDHIHAEPGEIAGGRASEKEVTLFKSVGVAVQDLAAATRVLARGTALQLGAEILL